MNQLTSRPSSSSSGASPARTEPSKPAGRAAHVGLVVAICAAVGVGLLAGPRASSAHHTSVSAPTHLVAQSTTPNVTGGPGNV